MKRQVAMRVAGLVLAGGEGRRMGGRDKGMVLLDGRPLVAHVIERLAPQVDCVLISANRSLDDYRCFGVPVMVDEPCWQGMGPLAGLASAASRLPPGIDAVQLMPCDTPCVPLDLVARLSARLMRETASDVCYPQSPSGPEPGMLLARTDRLATIGDYLNAGGRSLKGWLAAHSACVEVFVEVDAFANANDPERLLQLENTFFRGGCAASHDQEEAR